MNALVKNGVIVERATASFQAAGKTYPAGTLVVKTAQAFRPHILDMFEPQDHPNDFRYPGGPPIQPYDATGYTLAFQMGVKFDRVLDAVDGPLERVADLLKVPPGSVATVPHAAGYVFSHRMNNGFMLTNRLLKQACDVYWGKTPPAEGAAKGLGNGAVWVQASAMARATLEQGAKELGVNVYALAHRPAEDVTKLKPARIGLFDQYGGLMPSGWTRWIFEQYEFPFQVVYPQELDAGNLASKYDVLVFTDGAVRAQGDTGRGEGERSHQPKPEEIPAEYRAWLGRVTTEKTIPQIRSFNESGGAVVAIGSSTSLAGYLDLPLKSALTERGADGKEKPLPPEKYYIPGSLLTVTVDRENPLAYGVPENVDVFFDRSPVFRLNPDAQLKGATPVAWFPNASPSLVWEWRPVAQRMGVGPTVFRRRRRNCGSADRERKSVSAGARSGVSRPTSSDVQIHFQWDLLWACSRGDATLRRMEIITVNIGNMEPFVLHISEADLVRDVRSILERLQTGTEVIIERNDQPFAILRAAAPVRRTLAECIAALSPDSTATIDPDFAKDVEAAIASHREALEPPAWD